VEPGPVQGHRYQGPRHLPGPDSHRLAALNLSLLRHVDLPLFMTPEQSQRTCRRRHKHQLRHAHAVELAREGVPLPVIQRQLGHSHLSTTGTYVEGINTEGIISTVHARRAPMMHASAGLAL
jgi:integrase